MADAEGAVGGCDRCARAAGAPAPVDVHIAATIKTRERRLRRSASRLVTSAGVLSSTRTRRHRSAKATVWYPARRAAFQALTMWSQATSLSPRTTTGVWASNPGRC